MDYQAFSTPSSSNSPDFVDNLLTLSTFKNNEENNLINETVLNLALTPLRISTGLSSKHGFLPTVKITYLSHLPEESLVFCFFDLDWWELIENMQHMVKKDIVYNEAPETKILQDYTLTCILCEGETLIKLEKCAKVLYFCKEWIDEIKLYFHVVDLKLKLLKNIDFITYYNSVLLHVTMYDVDATFFDRIKNVCSLRNSIQTYCMLEYLVIDYNQILCDISKLMYMQKL